MDGPGGSIMHCELQIGDSRLMIGDKAPEMGRRAAAFAAEMAGG